MGPNLGQAVADIPDSVHEQTIGGTLNLEVAEEGICAEEREDLVQDIVALVVGIGRFMGRERRRGLRESVGGSTSLGAQRKEGEVADEAGRIGVGVEDGVVGLVERWWLVWSCRYMWC